VPTITDSGDTCTLEITFENALISLQLAPNRRFTDVDQQIDFPGDTGMAYVGVEQNLFLPFPYYAQTDASGDPPATEDGLTLSPASPLVIAVGSNQQMTATCEFLALVGGEPGQANVTSAGLWVSSDPSVCAVTNGTGSDIQAGNFGTGGGVITGVGPGLATVTITFGTVSASLTVIVVPAA
jgi:hypothetical protein